MRRPTSLATAALLLSALLCSIASAADLPRSTPESQGVSSAAILSFLESADKDIDSLHSLMILRRGQVIAEGWWSPCNAQSPHSLFSLSKSFTSTAIGIAIAEGKLKIDDPVLKFFPDDAPATPSANLKAMRISDLLRMNTGHQTEPPRKPEEPWVKTFLNHPVPFKPGTHFLYNTSATYMASAILQKATGQTLLDYLRPRLFEPLGIQNPTWESSPQGITFGGSGLAIRTEDIAKFGQLYLQKGKWYDKQLIPESWIAAATARQTSNGSSPTSDWDQGYGYQFWRCRHNAYRGDGAFGQYCIILPDHDAVIVMTAGLKDMQAPLNLVWDKLLPAFKSSPLPADDAATQKLRDKLKSLSLRPVDGAAAPAQVSGRSYIFPANPRKIESITLDEGEANSDPTTLFLRIDGIDRRIPCPRGSWHKTRSAWARFPEQPSAASGAWTADDTFTAKLCFYETPTTITLTLKFTGDELHLTSESNVAFGPTKDTPLIGKNTKP